MTEPTTVQFKRPMLIGPRRRWRVLWLWVLLLVGIVVTQYLTRYSFSHGYLDMSSGGPIQTTDAEVTWYFLPPILLVCVSVFFFIAARWLIPEKGTRTIIRGWGFLITFVTVIYSLATSFWFFYLIFYMD